MRITQWFCDGCDELLGTSEERPETAIDLRVEVISSHALVKIYGGIFCRACEKNIRQAIDVRHWPIATGKALVPVEKKGKKPKAEEDGA
jgi:hypothetical protein